MATNAHRWTAFGILMLAFAVTPARHAPRAGEDGSTHPSGDTTAARSSQWSLHANTWPVSVRLGQDQAIVITDHVAGPGETVAFRFAPSSTLYANGAVWWMLEPEPGPRPPDRPGTIEAWADSLRARYNAAEGPDPEARARTVLSGMKTNILDPTRPPTVTGTTVTAHYFMHGIRATATIHLEDREFQAWNVVRGVAKRFSDSQPAVWINTPGRMRILSGEQAQRIVPVLLRASSGLTTPADRELADTYSLRWVLDALAANADR